MLKIAISSAASNLLRALIARAGVPRDRILLTDIQSTDWQSLTLTGERHQFELRVSAPHSDRIVDRMCAGLEDAEFSIPGLIVADIAVAGGPDPERDGSTRIAIEALTIEE
jgi:hypothetical protein